MPVFLSAVVLVLIVVLVLVLIVLLILVLVLVIHNCSSEICTCGIAAPIV